MQDGLEPPAFDNSDVEMTLLRKNASFERSSRLSQPLRIILMRMTRKGRRKPSPPL
jgi:hypothetical protein